MYKLHVGKSEIRVAARTHPTSGAVNSFECQFEFSAGWADLIKTAVFKAGSNMTAVVLDDSAACAIPWEVLQTSGIPLYCGVYGINSDGDLVLPTVWACLGKVLEGVDLTDATNAQDPTATVYQQYIDQVNALIEAGITDDQLASALATYLEANPLGNVTVVQELTEGTLIATIDGTPIYAPEYLVYDGDTEVTPTVEGTTLETAGTLVEDDITVTAIPVSDVSNDAGGVTVTIA